MIAFDKGFRKEWFLQKEKMAKANEACHTACGMSLHDAWTISSGCYIGHPSHWMSPEKIAKGIAKVVFDWGDE
jgi:hypothetical protein